MIPVQPFDLSRFTRTSARVPSSSVPRHYYLSFEDALWDLVATIPFVPGTRVLVPEFWCRDVIDNMTAHGLQCHFYPVDRSFQTTQRELADAIERTHPQIIVIFHAVGIRNRLLTEHTDWMRHLQPDQYVIEDAVHCVLDPEEVELHHPHHVVIDSWRKVVPLQGACLYASDSVISALKKKSKRLGRHGMWVLVLWAGMQASLHAQRVLGGYLARLCGHIAERLMIRGYDLVGDNRDALTIPMHFVTRHYRLDIRRIRSAKRRQVALYEEHLGTLIEAHPDLFAIWRRDSDDALLRGYPIGLHLERARALVSQLREEGLMVRSELDDSPWSMRHKVMYLPLGPHLADEDIAWVCDTLAMSIRTF